MSETLICIAEDVGVRVWLERVLEDEWSLEFVSAVDLSRINRLVQASKARVMVIATSEDDPAKTTKLFSAVHKANPDLNLVAVARHISQELLLDVMRAGARDCLITAVDADSAKERIGALAAPLQRVAGRAEGKKTKSVTLVLGAASVVDTPLFAQNLACELNQQQPGGTVLAIDTMATENRTFYLDSLSRLSLNDLVNRTDSIDESFVNTALEEYAPGLRLLSGKIMAENLAGDAAADLFIAISRLSDLFDHLIIRVVEHQAETWLKILGSDITRMLVVAHPVVDQTRYTESLLQTSRHWLGTDCESHVVIDGYEKRATLSLAELEKSMGRETSLRLPMEWLSRLDSINAGVPLSALPRSSTYQKKLAEFVKKYYVGSRPVTDSLGLFKKRRVAQE